jgi:VWFA-related protein
MSRFVAVVAVALAGASVAARQEPLSQPPAFRAGIEFVGVDVVAQDKNARFVTDLRADEFELQDDGEPQRIDFVRLVESGTPRPGLSGGSTSADAGGVSVAQVEARGAHVFVALFDTKHLTPTAFKRVQAAAFTLFSKQFKSGDLGGVVSDGRLTNNRFTADREELLMAVRSARPGQRAGARSFDHLQWPRMTDVEALRIVVNQDAAMFDAVTRRACAEDTSLCRLADAAVRAKATQLAGDAQAESAQTLETLVALLNGLSRLDGRKTVLLLTEGLFAQASWPLVQDAIGRAMRADARVYALDARALDRPGMADYLRGSFSSDEGVSALMKQFDFSDDAMNSLAVDTGGFVVRNASYFDSAVSQIAADASTYYMLGYRPQKAADGKLHRITVKVKRAGVAIRARRGYVATVGAAAVTSASSSPSSSPLSSASSPASGTAAPTSSETKTPERDTTTAEPTVSAVGQVAAPSESGRASDAVLPNAKPSPGYRLRPDGARHVDLLLSTDRNDNPATAGWAAYQRGDVTTARAALKSAAASPSARPWVHYALGMAEYALGEFNAAIGEWETVRRRVADFEPVYFDLVDALLQLKEHDQAIRVLRAARDRWPHDVEVYNALGVIQTVRGVLDDAIKSFQEAITTAPEEATSYFNLARALEMRYVRSRRYVQQLRAWVTNEQDRAGAIENYRRYLQRGGPFASQAQDGLTRLRWPSP